MTRLAEDYDYVIGGGPDRDTIDLAVLDTATGGIRAHIEAPADGPGYVRMLDWARTHAPGRRVWALEGTGSFAAGLAGELALAGEDVVEVGALRHARGPKNDRLDAVRAARTAMSRDHQPSPRVRGLGEVPTNSTESIAPSADSATASSCGTRFVPLTEEQMRNATTAPMPLQTTGSSQWNSADSEVTMPKEGEQREWTAERMRSALRNQCSGFHKA